VKGIHNFSNEGQPPFPKGDNSKKYTENLKKSTSPELAGQFQYILV
jgi:hypothetical protein